MGACHAEVELLMGLYLALTLRKQPAIWVLSNRDQQGLADMGHAVPSHIHVTSFAPQNDVLAHHNTRAFITQGGTNSMYEVRAAIESLESLECVHLRFQSQQGLSRQAACKACQSPLIFTVGEDKECCTLAISPAYGHIPLPHMNWQQLGNAPVLLQLATRKPLHLVAYMNVEL